MKSRNKKVLSTIVFSFGVLIALTCKNRDDSETLAKPDKAVNPENVSDNFDIIDTSFLLPFPSKSGFSIKAFNEKDPEKSIYKIDEFKQLPKEFIEQVPGKTAKDLLDMLYITGFRFDPCFPKVPDGLDPFDTKGCTFRAIRLVGQFIDFSINPPVALPASMHILFQISTTLTTKIPLHRKGDVEKTNDLIAKLSELKKLVEANRGKSTNGIALGVHPGFGIAEFEGKFRQILLDHATHKRLFGTSVFFQAPESNGETHWKWAQLLNVVGLGTINVGGMGPNPLFKLLPTSGMAEQPAKEKLIELVKKFAGKGDSVNFGEMILSKDGKLSMIPRDADLADLKLSLSSLLANRDAGNIDGISAAYVNENPKLVGIPDGACVTCHVATQQRLDAQQHGPGGTRSTGVFSPAAGITGVMNPSILATMKRQVDPANPGSLILINFGYSGREAVISQRTVNEAARATELINGKLLKANWGAGQ